MLKSDVNKKNVNLLKTNNLEPLKVEMEKMNNYMEQFNNKLNTVTMEMSNEKRSNIELMNSVTVVLDKNFELEQKLLEGFSYKEKLDSTIMELENVVNEKIDLLKRYTQKYEHNSSDDGE